MSIANAAHCSMIGGGKKWVNPYVTDSLVAMWDGEWNAGKGIHDASATSWVDLVNGLVANSSTAKNPSWTDNSFVGSQTTAFLADGTSLMSMIQSGEYSIEVCIGEKRVIANEGGVFSIGNIGTGVSYNSGIYLKGNVQTNTAYNACVNTSTYGLNNIFKGEQTFAICASVSSFSNYIDGVYKAARSATCGFTPLNNNIYIGRYYYGLVQCDIHSIRLYSRALTASEIAANYAIDRARFNLPTT